MRSETNLEVRSNCALDLLRLVCAVAVVFIHSAPGFYGAAGQSINGALHMPPLVFFLISGYFWRDARGETSRERCRRRFVKTLKMTVFWVVAYMLFTTALVYPFTENCPAWIPPVNGCGRSSRRTIWSRWCWCSARRASERTCGT